MLYTTVAESGWEQIGAPCVGTCQLSIYAQNAWNFKTC